MEELTATTIMAMDNYLNSSTLSSFAAGEMASSTTEKPFAESFNETLQKVITTKDMVHITFSCSYAIDY